MLKKKGIILGLGWGNPQRFPASLPLPGYMVLLLSGGRGISRKLGFESASATNSPWTNHFMYPQLSFFICKIRKSGWMICKVPSTFDVHFRTMLYPWPIANNKCWFMKCGHHLFPASPSGKDAWLDLAEMTGLLELLLGGTAILLEK